MKCPKCRLINPDTALRCDCGYDFASDSIKESYLDSQETKAARLASLGQRLLGRTIDLLIFIPALAIAVIFPNDPLALMVALVFGGLYTLFADGLNDGQSYGKRLVNTAVIDAKSEHPSTFSDSFVRNLFLNIGVLDWVVIFGRRRQRLGDKAAGTVVIRSSHKGSKSP